MSLEVRGVTLRADNGVEILRSVTLTVPDGSVTLLVGRTGSGKSSLIDVLAGLRAPSEGAVTVDGLLLWRSRRPDARALRRLGVVFQFPEHQLFARTVRGEFRYSLAPYNLPPAEAERRMLDALAAVGLSRDVLDLPPLLLSGGQRRRVSLASTLACEPAWLLLDEPTAGIDPEGVRLILQVLETRRSAGSGCVIATHDWDAFLPLADQVVWLDEGRIRFAGAPDEWLKEVGRRSGTAATSGNAQGALQNLGETVAWDLGEPAGLTVWRALAARGVTLPQVPLDPDELAAMVEAASASADAEGADSARDASAAPPDGPAGRQATEVKTVEPAENGELDAEPAGEVRPSTGASLGVLERVKPRAAAATPAPAAHGAWARRLDPRAKWLAYMLLCAGIAMQHRWTGLAVATVFAVAFVKTFGVDWRALWRISKGLLVFVVLSALLSGVRLSFGAGGRAGFSPTAALDTVRRLYPLWLLVTTGLALPASTSTMMMKRGLEAGLSPLRRLGIPVDAVALACALVLRFIPVILAELGRFTRIARARGKHPGAGLRPRDLPAVVLPLVLSVMELGESLSLAMEARGYVRIGQRRTHAVALSWTRADTWTVAGGAAAFGMLWLVHSWL
jgi:energy-coupling factor transporter ATP-binding protein EcfA2/energy-coupling factor transporter transmembrane protein EcfT